MLSPSAIPKITVNSFCHCCLVCRSLTSYAQAEASLVSPTSSLVSYSPFHPQQLPQSASVFQSLMPMRTIALTSSIRLFPDSRLCLLALSVMSLFIKSKACLGFFQDFILYYHFIMSLKKNPSFPLRCMNSSSHWKPCTLGYSLYWGS